MLHGSGKDNNYFLNLINSEDGDYSKCIYFYLNSLMNNKDFKQQKTYQTQLTVDSNLLILQSKKWIKNIRYSFMIIFL